MQTDFIFYQIYPWSFCDSNDDGIGDINGIISKIPYLKELGVTAVWLSPCFKSPRVDNGYDISDYLDIDEKVGSLAEFEKMLALFHENGIKIILDFVANHTSEQHFWFQEARKSTDNPYREYYIWRKTPPNDWQSVFGGPAWEYDERTGEYYLHSYAVEQPDLNWENPKVRQEMKNVLSFWLKKGVDGFRCDVLDMISKDFISGKNGNGPRLHEFIKELFDFGEKEFFSVGECWTANKENVEQFCGKNRKELTTVFCFEHLLFQKGRFALGKPFLYEVCQEIARWQELTQELDILPTVFLENHDQPRSVSRFGDESKRYESATLLGGLTLLHKGVPFLYQGQEIGLTNFEGKEITDFNDLESRNFYEENKGKLSKEELLKKINFGGRDNARLMMPWTAEKVRSWQVDYEKRTEINVAKDRATEQSVFGFYKRLIALRKSEKALSEGNYECKALNKDYYVFERSYQNETVCVYVSFEKGVMPKINGEILLDNYGENKEENTPYRLVVTKRK